MREKELKIHIRYVDCRTVKLTPEESARIATARKYMDGVVDRAIGRAADRIRTRKYQEASGTVSAKN